MGNALTGDFEAVLQLSGGTINELLAGMHQNAGVNPNLPSFPPVISIRIGDDRAIDGVRGTVQTQISVPHIELINGATDRSVSKCQIRAWYKPDASTTPLPAFIRGTVRAEYHFEDIDPKCLGWSQRAADYLWIRVNPDTVQFQGDAEEDRGLLLSPIDPASDAANKARITKQIAVQLATRFEATPHPVSKHFRRGSLRSLTSPGASAVVMPLGISGEPVGQVTSINSLLIGGSDFAVAISRDSILALAAPTVAAIQGFNPTVHVHVSTPWPAPDIDTVYRVGISPPTVDWLAQGSYAVIKIKASGSAKTDSIFPMPILTWSRILS